MKKGLFLLLFFGYNWVASAQCAMCKTTIVNNVSNGELALAEGLNFGIMYLFASPYLAIIVVFSIVIYKMRKHAQKLRSSNTRM